MIDHELAQALTRINDLELAVKWLEGEVGRLSERLVQATAAEDIIRRARQSG